MRRLLAALLLVVSCCAPVVAAVCTNTFTTRAGKGSTLTWAELDADISNAQLDCSWADAPDLASAALTFQVPNDGTTGTTNKLVAKLSAGKAIKAGTSDSKSYGLLGVVVSGGTTSGNAKIAISGTVTCTFDGTATQGDFVALSTGTAGDCHDAGSTLPTDGTLTFGIVAATHSGSGDTTLYPYSPDVLSIGYPVQGPSSATDKAIARYDATTGKLIQDSAFIISDDGFGTPLITVASGNMAIWPATGGSITIAGDAVLAHRLTCGGSSCQALGTWQIPGGSINAGTVAAARLGSGSPSSANFLRGDQTWSAPPGRVEMPMAASVLSNVVGTAQAQDDCTLAATNLGTTLKQYGSLVLAKMDGYSNVALSCRVKEGSTQSGTITMQLQNLTDGTTTVSAFTTTTTTCATVTGTASSVALTGYKEFAAQIKSANSTDDPLWGSCTLVLEP